MLPGEAFAEVERLRTLILRLGVARMRPEAQAIFREFSGVTRTATVRAAIAVFGRLLAEEAKKTGALVRPEDAKGGKS